MSRRRIENPYYAAVRGLKPYNFHHTDLSRNMSANSYRHWLWGPNALGPMVAAGPDGSMYEARRPMVEEYAWAIPTTRVIFDLAQYSPLLELGAGTGYWAWLLRQAGADVIATDKREPEQVSARRWVPDVQALPGVEAVHAHPGRTLFLCWPSYDVPWSHEALRAYTLDPRGPRVIYIGEGSGGCTATDEFHALLDEEWDHVRSIDIPQWEGLHDYVRIYERPKRKEPG